jgi:hypothetical protein
MAEPASAEKRMAKKQQIAVDATRSALVAAGPYSRPQRRMAARIPPLASRFPSATINESSRPPPNIPLSKFHVALLRRAEACEAVCSRCLASLKMVCWHHG